MHGERGLCTHTGGTGNGDIRDMGVRGMGHGEGCTQEGITGSGWGYRGVEHEV